MSNNDRTTPAEIRMSRRHLLTTAAMAGTATVAGGAALVGSTSNASAKDRGPVWKHVKMPEQVKQTEGMVDVGDGVRLWYWDTGGSGQPIILLHAGTGSGAVWGYQQPVFAKAGYRVIGYSRRGYYKSDAGSNANPGTASEDLAKLIEHLKLDKVHLLAAAHGGYFMLDYAMDNPAKVRSITVLSSLMGITDKDYVDVNNRVRPKFFAQLPHSFQELSPSYRAGDPEGVEAWEKLDKQAIPGERINPKLSKPITWARLETIKTPTLLMTGDGDLYLPPALLRMQALHIKHAEVRIIDEAGHAANWERPEIFNKIVLDFLKKHRK